MESKFINCFPIKIYGIKILLKSSLGIFGERKTREHIDHIEKTLTHPETAI